MDEPQGQTGQAGGGMTQGGSRPLLDDGHPDSLLQSGGVKPQQAPQQAPKPAPKPMPSISQMQGLKDAIEKAGASIAVEPGSGVNPVRPMQVPQNNPLPRPQAPVQPQTPVQQQKPPVGFPFSVKPAPQVPVQQVQVPKPLAQMPQASMQARPVVPPQPVTAPVSPVQKPAAPQQTAGQPASGLQIKPFGVPAKPFLPSIGKPNVPTPPPQVPKPASATSLQPARPLMPQSTPPKAPGSLEDKVKQFVDKRLEDEGFWGKNPGTSQAVWDMVKERPAAELASGPLPTEEMAWEKFVNFDLLKRAYMMVRDVAQKSGKQPQQGQTVVAFLTAQKETL